MKKKEAAVVDDFLILKFHDLQFMTLTNDNPKIKTKKVMIIILFFILSNETTSFKSGNTRMDYKKNPLNKQSKELKLINKQ